MNRSLHALLSGIVDYAGLFPPAKLPFDQAIRNYDRYRRDEDAWMLSCFVVPAVRLKELDAYRDDLIEGGPTLELSVLVGGGGNGSELSVALRSQLDAIEAFLARHGAVVRVRQLELALPESGAAAAVAGATREIVDRLGNEVSMFFELPACERWDEWSCNVIDAIGSTASPRVGGARGFKLRCGGPEPSAFPTLERVASVLLRCRDAGAAFKATAGLHHPIRHERPSEAVTMHGFLNVFTAGVLAGVGALDEQSTIELLDEREAAAFGFDDESLTWRGRSASIVEINEARRQGCISFGSCSFDEPREDLLRLGLLAGSQDI